ncbi:MAG: PTS transporter subunit EIIC [Erysipelotrichaceae bacterium]|nr:PTS transporter subunit EIIC [Erysipelotrichaceae bacterium]
MAKYDVLAEKIVETLGEKDNITFFTHCTTRLRVSLKDKSLVNVDALKGIEGVIDCRWTADQVQIIVGPHVPEVYDTICDRYGLQKQSAIDENLDKELTEKKKNSFNFYFIVEIIAYALQPALSVLIGAGMIKVLLLLLGYAGVPSDNPSYQLLFNAADAVYYFLPIIVGYGVAKKIGSEPALGIVVGMFLVAPNFIANVNGGVPMNFLGLSVYPKAYTSTFLPPILCTVATCYLYGFLEKRVPKVIKNLVAPLCTFLVMIPLSYVVLAPLASILGDYLAKGVMWIYNLTGFVGVAMFCGILPFLITTGIHFCFSAYWVPLVTDPAGEFFYLISNCIFNVNVGICCAVIGLKTKIVENKSTAVSAGISSAIAGISEPALFGVVLKNKRALAALIIGDLVGGAVAGLLKVAAHMWPASWGIFMLPSFIDPATGAGFVGAVIAVIAGIVVTAVATFILYKDEAELEA